jgi:hypothetical protein
MNRKQQKKELARQAHRQLTAMDVRREKDGNRLGLRKRLAIAAAMKRGR